MRAVRLSEVGQQRHETIKGKPAYFWINLFELCHEWHGTYYYLKEYPNGKGTFDQVPYLLQIFQIIKNEKLEIIRNTNG